ncbi:Hsp20/alpha crystallin family protein [Opitutus terrae]|uniref:Heat shock protein Hsp20 n=1 Tax=Opitutus terrae (strain DSM 11246 / JCM 15787 / PB90-1) TaxID=452637 RepID=B1ZS67_OPITP|nr:Hsp20/alpha crystallin family protein [Opitutus terrae]ACB75666.1 heat shock protein Hsp20 [Opitutus terrae PB90-1]
MHTIIHPSSPPTRSRRAERTTSSSPFRQPSYECRELADAVKLAVYVPGVDASGVEIEARGPDLLVTARKPHFVRVNWTALHLESAQRDYQLRLRLGHDFDYPALQAEIDDGVLTVTLPKLPAASGGRLSRPLA